MSGPGPFHRPAWCTAKHVDEDDAHTADVGDLELSDTLTLSVSLLKVGDEPTMVQLTEDAGDLASVRGLQVGEALELRDLLVAATTHILQEGAWS